MEEKERLVDIQVALSTPDEYDWFVLEEYEHSLELRINGEIAVLERNGDDLTLTFTREAQENNHDAVCDEYVHNLTKRADDAEHLTAVCEKHVSDLCNPILENPEECLDYISHASSLVRLHTGVIGGCVESGHKTVGRTDYKKTTRVYTLKKNIAYTIGGTKLQCTANDWESAIDLDANNSYTETIVHTHELEEKKVDIPQQLAEKIDKLLKVKN